MNDFIKDLSNKTISKEMAVTLFGTKKQQEHFKKYGKFVNTDTEEALLKTLREYYHGVDKVKVGRSYQYQLEEAREEKAERIDNRGKNNEISYTKYLDAVVLMALDNKVFTQYEATMNEWVNNFGLVNQALYILKKYGLRSKKSLPLREELVNKGVIHSIWNSGELKEFIEDFDTKKGILKRALIRMDKEGLIDFYKVPKVKLKEPIVTTDSKGNTYEQYVLTIDSETHNRINEKQRELRERYNLSSYQLLAENRQQATEDAEKNIKSYDKEMSDFFTEMYIRVIPSGEYIKINVDYFWLNYAISVKATKKRIANYIEKHRPDFYELYINDSNDFFNDSKENFSKERENHVLKNAYKKAKKMQDEIRKEFEEKNKDAAFGIVDDAKMKHLPYWEEYPKVVEQLMDYMREDFIQDIHKNRKKD